MMRPFDETEEAGGEHRDSGVEVRVEGGEKEDGDRGGNDEAISDDQEEEGIS
jgi:hypothetical protein